MSQQNMEFNEGYREQQYHSNDEIPDYAGSAYQAPAQKVTSDPWGARERANLGGRIAVAICSLAFLIPLSAITLSNSGLIAFGIVCLTMIIINIVFNARNWTH